MSTTPHHPNAQEPARPADHQPCAAELSEEAIARMRAAGINTKEAAP